MKDNFRINENLIVDSQFKDFLLHKSIRVNALILGFKTLPGINYIAITDKIDTISYLPSSKLEYVENNFIDPYSDGIGRAPMKIGRLVSKLFPKNLIDEYILPSDIEEFVNLYKSFFDLSNRRLSVVIGSDIKKFYLYKSYSYPERGTLWKSCMRHRDRQDFLELYVKNPDKVKMLVLLANEDGVERLRARALLWEDVEDTQGNKLKVMDRIYTIFDSDIYVFKNWARENGYISKFYQNAKTQNIFDINGDDKIMNLNVELKEHSLYYYPYLDTFQFYDPTSGKFHNNAESQYEYTLIQSNGALYPHEEPEPEDDMYFDPGEDF